MPLRHPNVDRLALYCRVGQALRQIREARGVSADDLATACGTAKGSLYHIETGRTPCPLHIIVSAAKFFDVTVDSLIPRHDS